MNFYDGDGEQLGDVQRWAPGLRSGDGDWTSTSPDFPYFIDNEGTISDIDSTRSDGWVHVEAIMAHSDTEDPDDMPNGKNIRWNFVIPDNAVYAQVRFLNRENSSDNPTDFLIHSPKIHSTDDGVMRANKLQGGILESENDNTWFDLNNGDFHIEDANFEISNLEMQLSEGATIEFQDARNYLYRTEEGYTSGVSFSTSEGYNLPLTVVGVNPLSSEIDANNYNFRGWRVHHDDSDHRSNLVASVAYFLARPDHSLGGFAFRNYYEDETNRAIHPWDHGDEYTHDLGQSSTERRFANIYLRNSPDVSSDERLKTNVEEEPLGKDFLRNIETWMYNHRTNNDNHGKKQFGVMAQQVIDSIEDAGYDWKDLSLVSYNDDNDGEHNDEYGIRYEQFIPILIRAVQEMARELEELKNE